MVSFDDAAVRDPHGRSAATRRADEAARERTDEETRGRKRRKRTPKLPKGVVTLSVRETVRVQTGDKIQTYDGPRRFFEAPETNQGAGTIAHLRELCRALEAAIGHALPGKVADETRGLLSSVRRELGTIIILDQLTSATITRLELVRNQKRFAALKGERLRREYEIGEVSVQGQITRRFCEDGLPLEDVPTIEQTKWLLRHFNLGGGGGKSGKLKPASVEALIRGPRDELQRRVAQTLGRAGG